MEIVEILLAAVVMQMFFALFVTGFAEMKDPSVTVANGIQAALTFETVCIMMAVCVII